MRVLVTGVNGQLGYDCMRELSSRGYDEILGIDIDDLDITNEAAVHRFINVFKPDVVMHNAAWTAVDKAEQMPDKVYMVNALGPKYIAEACKEVNAKMVYISTDYVFDGKGNQFMIPRGFAHGFVVLSETATFCYKCDELYHPEDEGGIMWNDPDIDITWPFDCSNVILSEKDKVHPLLKNSKIEF